MEKVKWYLLAIYIWIFVFPITGITAWAFMISGPLAIVVGILKFVFKLLGIDIAWMNIYKYNLGIFTKLIIALVTGILLTIAGICLWKVTKKTYKWLNSLNPNN